MGTPVRLPRDLLLVVGILALVLGLRAAGSAALSPKPASELGATAQERPRATAAPPTTAAPTPPLPAVQPRHEMDGAAFGVARAYLLEMSARLRYTTLGADAATRDAVAADFNSAYAWLGATDAAQERTGATPFDGNANGH